MRRVVSYLPESSTTHLLDDAARRGGVVIGEEPFGAPLGKVFTTLGNPTPVDLASFMVDDFKPVTKDATKPNPVLPITTNGTYYICCTKGSEIELTSASGHIYGVGVDTTTNGDSTSVIAEDVVVHIDAQPDGADVLLKSGTVIYINKVGATAVVPHTTKEAGCGMYEDKDNKNSGDVPLKTWNEAWRVAYKELPPDSGGVVLPNVLEIENEEDGINTIELTGTGVDLVASCRKTTTTTDKRDLYGIPVLSSATASNPTPLLPHNYHALVYGGHDVSTRSRVVRGGIPTKQPSLVTHLTSETGKSAVGTFTDEYTLYGEPTVPYQRTLWATWVAHTYNGKVVAAHATINVDSNDAPPPNPSGYVGTGKYQSSFERYEFNAIANLGTRLYPRQDRDYWSNGFVCVDGSISSSGIASMIRGTATGARIPSEAGATVPSTETAVVYPDPSGGTRVSSNAYAGSSWETSSIGTPIGHKVEDVVGRRTRIPFYFNSVLPTVPNEDALEAIPTGSSYTSGGAAIYYYGKYGNKIQVLPSYPTINSLIQAGILSWDGTYYTLGQAILSVPVFADSTVIQTPTYVYMPPVPQDADVDSLYGYPPNLQPAEGEPVTVSGNSLLSVDKLYYSKIVYDIRPSNTGFGSSGTVGATIARRVTAGAYTFPVESVEEKVTKNILRAKTSGISIYPQQVQTTVAEPAVDLSGANDVPHPDFVRVPAPATPVDTQVTNDIL